MRCIRCKAADGGARLCAECRRELREGKRDPSEVVRLFEDGAARLQLGDFTAATRAFQKLVRRDERNLGAYESLILAHGFLGRFDRAVAALSAMHGVTAGAAAVVDAVATEKPSGSRRRRAASVSTGDAAKPATQASPPCEADMVSLGLFYRQLCQLDLAEAVLKQVLEVGESSPEAHLVLGSVYREQGKLRLALRHLKVAFAAGESAAVCYEMGLCHEGLGQLKRANTLVARAVALEPDNPHMHLSLGMLCEKLGHARLARREYRVASSLNSAFAPALVDISFRLGLEALEDGNLDRAMHEFQAGLEENPHLFAPGSLSEIDHLLVQIIRAEQFRNFLDSYPGVRKISGAAMRALEESFSTTARMAFFIGLSYYWDGCYDISSGENHESEVYGPVEAPEACAYEPVEPEAAWLEGPGPSGRVVRGATPSTWRRRRPALESEAVEEAGRDDDRIPRPTVGEPGLDPAILPDGRRIPTLQSSVGEPDVDPAMLPGGRTPQVPEGFELPAADELAAVRAQVNRAEAMLGFPPVPFEFVFEEWLDVHERLSSPRIAERPLVSPDAYQRLLSLLGASLRRVREVVHRAGVGEIVGEEEDSGESVDLAMALWATIIESFLLRVALEACRAYPREFLARYAMSERYRERRFFGRAIRELEAALPLKPKSASLHNFLWNLYIREWRFAEALEHCQAVLDFTRHYLFQAAAFNDMAYCMVELGQDLDRALLYTDKARELAPHLFDAQAADTVAWLRHRQGDHEEALRLIEQVVEAGRSDDRLLVPTAVHFYHYGHVLQALGRTDEAQQAFARALEMEVDAESDWGVSRRLRQELGDE